MKKIFIILLLVCSNHLLYAQLPFTGRPTLYNTANTAVLTGIRSATITDVISPTTTPVTTAQWHFAGQGTTPMTSDWLYSIAATDKKEYVGCGYSGSPAAPTGRNGAIMKLDHLGNLSWAIPLQGATRLDFSGWTLASSATFTPTLSTVPTSSSVTSSLWRVAKASDGYVAVGSDGDANYGNGILIVEFDDNGNFLNGTPIEVVAPANNPGGATLYPASASTYTVTGMPTGLSFIAPASRAYSVAIDPNTNSINNIIVGGSIVENTAASTGPNRRAFILTMNYPGSSPASPGTASAWAIGNTAYGGNNYSNDNTNFGGNVIAKILTQQGTGGAYNIYACGTISGTDDNHIYTTDPYGAVFTGSVTSIAVQDKDIWLVKMSYESSTQTFSLLANATYNKSISIGGTAINSPGFNYTYNEAGPLTARNYAGSSYSHPTGINAVLPYGSLSSSSSWFGFVTSNAGDWLAAYNNEVEEGIDMIFAANGNLALIGLVNVVGNLSDNLDNNNQTYHLLNSTASGSYYSGAEYEDGDAFLLKIDPGTLALTDYNAKNVGHFSGADFTMNIKQDKNGQFIIAGSTADLYGTVTTASATTTYTPSADINLPVPYLYSDHSGWNAFIVGANDDANPDVWRRSFTATDTRAGPMSSGSNDEHTFCMFGMDLTADDGYVLCGNNDNDADDWTVTKFAPLNQQLMTSGNGHGTGTYNKFGLPVIPQEYDITGTQTWNSNMNVASKVVIKFGASLTITTCTVSFAASDQLYDYSMAPDAYAGGAIGCGIVVEPGGKLTISNATLQGISITGEHNVWDGIVVQGTPTGPLYPLPAQGLAEITNATIQDARYGLYVADNYRTYYQSTPVSYTTSGGPLLTGIINGWNFTSQYNGYATFGGGTVVADNVNFTNCRFGVNFQNSPTYTNLSTFETCTFTTTPTGMGDICFYTDADGDLLPANTHFASWNTTGIGIFGSTFTCDPSFIAVNRPVGVIAATSKMYISDHCSAMALGSCTSSIPGNTFTNLNYGIAGSASPAVSPALYIANNSFDNNGFCITASGMFYGLVITGNTFGIPGAGLFLPNPYAYPYPTGVTLAGCQGYDVTQNTFDKCAACLSAASYEHNRGIVVNDGAGVTLNDEVNLNQFNYVTYASIASQTNNGLQFLCNAYNNSYIDIDRSSTMYNNTATIGATLNSSQGSCSGGGGFSSATSPAGNQFYLACPTIGGDYRLHAEDASVTEVVTYNNNDAGSIYDPGSCINSSLYTDNSCLTAGTTPSVSVACPPPAPYNSDISVVKGVTDLALLDIAISRNTDPDLAAPLQAKHDHLVSYLARCYSLHDNYLAAALMLDYYQMYRGALPFYLMAGLYGPAQRMHDQLAMRSDEDNLYALATQEAIDLYSTGKTWMSLDSTLRDTLHTIVQYNSPTGYMAGGISMLVGNGTVTWPIPVMDTSIVIDTSGRSGDGSTQPIATINNMGNALFSIYPNPTFGNFTIRASGSGTFTVYTIIGQKVREYAVTAGQTELSLPGNLAAGMYMGTFAPDDESVTKEVKLVYKP